MFFCVLTKKNMTEYTYVVVKSLSYVHLFRGFMDCSLPGSSVHDMSQAGVGCHLLLQGFS